LIKVNEHNEMALGTTPFYDLNTTCAWHLVGASPYGALKFMKIGLKKSILKLPENYNDTGAPFEIAEGQEEPNIIRYYVANTYDEILKNGDTIGKTLENDQDEIEIEGN
jgi:hypothetical protein